MYIHLHILYISLLLFNQDYNLVSHSTYVVNVSFIIHNSPLSLKFKGDSKRHGNFIYSPRNLMRESYQRNILLYYVLIEMSDLVFEPWLTFNKRIDCLSDYGEMFLNPANSWEIMFFLLVKRHYIKANVVF